MILLFDFLFDFVCIFFQMYYTEGFPKSDLRQFIANDDCVDGIPVYESQKFFSQLWSLILRRRQDYEAINNSREEQPILA